MNCYQMTTALTGKQVQSHSEMDDILRTAEERGEIQERDGDYQFNEEILPNP